MKLNLGSVFVLVLATLAVVAKIMALNDVVYADGPWYVSEAPTGNNNNDCKTPSTPCATINGAIDKAASGDVIKIQAGVYTSDGPYADIVYVSKSVSLSGGWNAGFIAQDDMSTIEVGGMGRGLTVAVSTTVSIERLVIQNGSVTNFDDNYGGGLKNLGTLFMTHSAIRNNYVGGIGGGISNFGTMTLTHSAVTGNLSPFGNGAGISNFGTMTIINSTIDSNSTTNALGSVYNAASITIYNSTISNNSGTSVGGIYATAPVTLYNSLLSGNFEHWMWAQADCAGPVSSGGYNLVGVLTGCGLVPTTGDQIGLDPELEPLIGLPAYHPLALTSPAVDHGHSAGCSNGSSGLLMTDQRNMPRLNRCDIGAYEVQPLAFSGKTVNNSAPHRGDLLTYTVILTNSGNTDYATVSVTDTLPADLTYSDFLSSTSGNSAYTNGVITWTGSVPSGELVTITFKATVSPTAMVGSMITNAVTINGGQEVYTRLATITVKPYLAYLPLLIKPDPAAIVAEFPFTDRCVHFPVWYNGQDVHMTMCVTSVQIRLDGQMKFNIRWSVEFLNNAISWVCKGSDVGNPNMNATDNFGNRYDHVQLGGAAAQQTCFYRGSGPAFADGWYLFPTAKPGATVFIFHDDDQHVAIGNIVLAQ